MIILLIGRVVNLALPLTLGELVKILEGRSDRSPWPFLFGYVGLRFLQGSGGLAAIRDVSVIGARTINPKPNFLCVGSMGACNAVL